MNSSPPTLAKMSSARKELRIRVGCFYKEQVPSFVAEVVVYKLKRVEIAHDNAR